jgi:hypothetical protein
VKLFLNETTGNIEYLIDDDFYKEKKNAQISIDTIIKIFGEEFVDFLIVEKYDLIKDIRQYKLEKIEKINK